MDLKELAHLTNYLNTAMRLKRSELLKIRGANVSECFCHFLSYF
ncbi:hypothetical protein HpBHB2_15120 [Helicobacter pylori]